MVPWVVEDWIAGAKAAGVKSIDCLLNDQHLKLYAALPGGLIQAYRNAGFNVAHVPVADHQRPPLLPSGHEAVEVHFTGLPKPVLVHCSAGIDRTGAAVRHLKTRAA